MSERSGWWKVLGVAGLAGVVATGVVVTRQERQRRSYTPDEVRNRLHERYAALEADDRAEATRAWRERRTSPPAS